MSGKYTFRRDEEGHWYFIPVELVEEFDEWLQFMELKWGEMQYDLEWSGTDFEAFRSMPPQSYAISEWELV